MELIFAFFTTGFGIVLLIFLIYIAALWFFLPFAIFGIKKLLSELVELLKIIAKVQDTPDKFDGHTGKPVTYTVRRPKEFERVSNKHTAKPVRPESQSKLVKGFGK